MQSYLILTETVTYAIKGRDLLRKRGIRAKVEKMNSGKRGCSYAVAVNGNTDEALKILKNNGIRVLGVKEKQ